MAKGGEEVVDYDSDPEEEKRLLGMRRREAASDDEEGEVEGVGKPRLDRRAPIDSDESDGQGGAAEYDDDYDEVDELDREQDEEEVYEDEEAYEEEEIDGYQEGNEERRGDGRGFDSDVVEAKEKDKDGRNAEEGLEVKAIGDHAEGVGEEEQEGKKENEPFAVPTAGAFYMHDDRFRDNAGGRHRYESE